jgi:amidophosphoribosyltransferase
MCGVVGIYGKKNKEVAQDLYDSLISIQHRGQDSCGIATYNGEFHMEKDLGLVQKVFNEKNVAHLHGNMGVGHVRYSTVGKGTKEDAQPFIVNSPYGILMAHNGNITNFDELKKELAEKDLRQVNSCCDVDVILNVFASELGKQKQGEFTGILSKALTNVYKRLEGSYSVVSYIAGKGFLAFRDPHGIKPLVWGKRGDEYIFASENAMFSMLDFKFLGDVRPGEFIFIDTKGKVYRKMIVKEKSYHCAFEYVYFARPDSTLDEISVYKARLRMGNRLADRLKPHLEKLKIDVVIPAPTTADVAALTLAYDIGVKFRHGLMKNNFIGRTFIMPGQENRKKSVRYKLSPIELEIKDKNVLLLDDSIVRGTTSKQIVELLRKFGAKKVYFAVCCPPLKFPCVYGIDMPTRQELIANHLSIEQVKKMINADFLIYQTLEDLISTLKKKKSDPKDFCTACFSGKYPTNISKQQLLKIEKARLKER